MAFPKDLLINLQKKIRGEPIIIVGGGDQGNTKPPDRNSTPQDNDITDINFITKGNEVQKSIAWVCKKGSAGTGTIVSSSLFLTCLHVIIELGNNKPNDDKIRKELEKISIVANHQRDD